MFLWREKIMILFLDNNTIFKEIRLLLGNEGKILVYLQFFLGVTEWLFTSVGVRWSTCYSCHTSSSHPLQNSIAGRAGLGKGKNRDMWVLRSFVMSPTWPKMVLTCSATQMWKYWFLQFMLFPWMEKFKLKEKFIFKVWRRLICWFQSGYKNNKYLSNGMW